VLKEQQARKEYKAMRVQQGVLLEVRKEQLELKVPVEQGPKVLKDHPEQRVQQDLPRQMELLVPKVYQGLVQTVRKVFRVPQALFKDLKVHKASKDSRVDLEILDKPVRRVASSPVFKETKDFKDHRVLLELRALKV
jgi:hypothetical protein